MKKFFYILMTGLIVMLCGCGYQTEADYTGAAVNETADETAMGYIQIISGSEPTDDYQTAEVRLMEDSGDGSLQVKEQKTCELKLRGNSSKEVEKKAYTIKFKDDESLFGMEPGRKWALVSDPFDKSLLRPAVGFAYARALGIEYTSETRLCQIWLNDDYMGVYTAMEPAGADDADFLLERNFERYEEDVVYIDSPSGMRFEFNEPEEPDEMQQSECLRMLAEVEEAVFSKDHLQYEQVIDVDSFVDFYIFQEMIKDVDFGEYSTRYYFKDGKLYAGPPWDLDLTMGNVSAEKEEFKYASYNNIEDAGDGSGDSSRGLWAVGGDYYYWLCRDPWFMELVHQRWVAVRAITENLATDNEMGMNVIDGYLESCQEGLEANFEYGSSVHGSGPDCSWNVSEPAHVSEWQKPADTYLGNVELLRFWLIRRAAYLDSQFGPFVYKPALAVQ